MAYQSKDETEARAQALAFNYVFRTVGNKTQSLLLWCEEYNKPVPNSPRRAAYDAFKPERVQNYIEQFREEARKEYKDIRDTNIATLQQIAYDDTNAKRDRLAAVKELNTMFGYNSHNYNVQADGNIEIVIEG